MRGRRFVLALATAAALASCGDPLGPAVRTGVYTLKVLDGVPVPMTVSVNSVRTISGSIVLLDDGTGTFQRRVQVTYESGPVEYESVNPIRYEADWSTVTIHMLPPAGCDPAICDWVPTVDTYSVRGRDLVDDGTRYRRLDATP